MKGRDITLDDICKALMALSIIIFFLLLLAVPVLGDHHLPNGGYRVYDEYVVPERLRNGLTEEQFVMLTAEKGRQVKLSATDRMRYVFNSERGRNVQSYLEVLGRTNDFARLASTLATTNDFLYGENVTLTWTNRWQKAEIARLSAEVRYMVAENERLAELINEMEPDVAMVVRLRTALRDEGTLGPWLRQALVAERARTTDPLKREVFDACIALIDSALD